MPHDNITSMTPDRDLGTITFAPRNDRLQWRSALDGTLRKLRVHHLLFVAFTTVAAVPVLSLSAWVQHQAIEQEVDLAKDKHLLVARNMTAAFSRYVFDVKAGFDLAIATFYSGETVAALKNLLTSLEFRHVCIVDAATGRVERYMAGFADAKRDQIVIPPAMLASFRERLNTDETIITDLGRDVSGKPAFFLLRALSDGRIAYGVIGTDYLVRLQKAIAFGARGHSVVLDAKGKVVGHPTQDWVDSEFDLSKIPPARAIAAGQTGVMQFYSPAFKADMITAYTQVPETGWGIMVPQPMDELYDHASGVRRAAMAISFLGLLAAGLISWVLAKYIARPLQAIGSAALDISQGNLAARAPALGRHIPSEMRDLSTSFNTMVDEISRKNVELANTATRAEAANRAKSEFLANMSHELRTPLNAIQGFSEMMRDGMFGPLGHERYQSYATDINDSAGHLIKVITEILDLSKAESGTIDVQIEPTMLPDIFDLTLRLVEHRVEDSKLAIRRIVDPALAHEMVQTDAGKLTQILLNLLTNAVKFTPAGGEITLSAALLAERVEIFVRDTGIGIAPENIDNVMTPFGQVTSAYTVREGFGLGLPLSKKLTEMLGGELLLESTPGQGTTVTIILPRRSVERTQAIEWTQAERRAA